MHTSPNMEYPFLFFSLLEWYHGDLTHYKDVAST
jgi:hypothetical protein